jgi:hypothetical protein
LQAVAVVASWYWPVRQLVQRDDDDATAYLPTAQGEQADEPAASV